MNREPKRWLDDDNAPAEVRDLLRGSRRALSIDEGARARVGKRVARLAIVPASLLTWLGAKTALAALGAAAGLATVATVGALATRGETETSPVAPVSRPAPSAPKPALAPPSVESAAPEVLAPFAPAVPPPPKSASPMPSVAGRSSNAGGLAEETAFLERARRTLKTDPAFALILAREHAARFSRARLDAERDLIEIEALYRSGRHAEARALAEQKLASGAGDLYSGRVRALLERMDGER